MGSKRRLAWPVTREKTGFAIQTGVKVYCIVVDGPRQIVPRASMFTIPGCVAAGPRIAMTSE